MTSASRQRQATKALRSQQRANRAAQSLVFREEGLTSTRAQLEYVQTAGQLLAADTLAAPVECIARAAVEPDLAIQLQYSSLAAKWMAAMNSVVLTLKKFKASGEQRITIQHVNVSQGGQAVIGDVRSGGN